jgi:hypothetical protein
MRPRARYWEFVATEDVECHFCKQVIRKGETYLRYSATASSARSGRWESYRAHGRYPADCPNPQEGKTA